jgi:hypothetical protein
MTIKQLVAVDGFWAVLYNKDEFFRLVKVACLALTENMKVVAMTVGGNGMFEPVTEHPAFFSLIQADNEEQARERGEWIVGDGRCWRVRL